MDLSSKNQLLKLLRLGNSKREAGIGNELRRFSPENIADVVGECVNDLDDNTQLEILRYIEQLTSNEIEQFENILITLLQAPDGFVRSETLDIISRLDVFSRLDEVIFLADNDPDWLMKVSAIEVLADLATPQDPKILTVLYKILSDDETSLVRGYAAWAIGILGNNDSKLILGKCINEEESFDVQADILLSKFYLGENECLYAFLKLLEKAEASSINAHLNRIRELLERELNDSLQGSDINAIKDSLHMVSKKNQINNLSIERLLAILEVSKL